MSMSMHIDWQKIAEERTQERDEARARVEQVEAQLAVARAALDALEAAPQAVKVNDEDGLLALVDAVDRAHNLLDDALEWPIRDAARRLVQHKTREAPMTPSLYAHQREDADLAVKRGSLCIFEGTGTGKTATALAIIQRLPGPALVVCPLSIIEPAWMADARRFAPGLRVVSLWAPTPRKRKRAMQKAEHADVMLANYAGFRILWRNHRAWLLARRAGVLVVDESSAMKSPKAAITKALLAYGLGDGRGAPGVPHRFAMSGTPAPNALYEYWAQVRLVDASVFDHNYFRFQRRWFIPIVSDPTNPRVVWKWGIHADDREALLEKVARVSVARRKEDCVDLPPQVDVVRHATLAPDQQKAYDAMLSDFVTSLGAMSADAAYNDASAGGTDWTSDVAMAPNKLAQLMKLRQITAGCIAPLDGQMRWRWNAKLAVLGEVLDELGREQCVIWTQFRAEADAVMDFLEKRRIAARRQDDRYDLARLDGSVPVADRTDSVEAFQAGRARYMVAHPAAAAHGLTLTAASHAVYLSLSYSLEHYWQSRDRLHRIGQKRSCTYHHVIVPDTVDEVLLGALRRKGDIASAALEFVHKYKGQQA